MKKKTALLSITGILTALIVIVAFYKFGWKYTGFKMVSEPNVIKIEKVYEEGNTIVIEGTTSLKIGSFEGANTEFKDGVLHVGIRYSIFGNKNKFKFKYEEKEGKVHRVALRRLDTIKTVWIRPWEVNTDYENIDG
ncbi:MAG: hypothetical protein QMB63_07810 [Clostridiaceae bacterium]